jgi:nuclear protein localization family protein 4
MTITLRLRTKDGTERVTVDPAITLAALLDMIAVQLSLDRAEISVTRDGPGREHLPHGGAPLGVKHGDMLYLHYHAEREAVARYEEKDPFKRLASDGALRQIGAKEWTLTSYLDYRSQKEFKLGAAPAPHCAYVSVDAGASGGFLSHMQSINFACQRAALLYGRFTDDGGVTVDAFYEPAQDCTDVSIALSEDPFESRAHAVAGLLGLELVGILFAHPPRDYACAINEVILAAQIHARALEAATRRAADAADAATAAAAAAGKLPKRPDGTEAVVELAARRFVTLQARLILAGEEIPGVAVVEAYQLSDQALDLVKAGVFKQSATDARCAKTADAEAFFLLEGKPSRKATAEHFVSRVHDMARAYASPLRTGFAIANRPTAPQTQQHLREHLLRRRGEPFARVLADFQLLVFISHMLDMATDMPVLCQSVAAGDSSQLDGFQMMLNAFADIADPIDVR